MTVNAPTLVSALDATAAGGDTVNLTIIPPAAGDYDHTQILYRVVGASAWTPGATYTGAQGESGTEVVDGLTSGALYEFLLYALDGSDNAGPPSISKRAIPTTGDGTRARRIEKNILSTLNGILASEGMFEDVGEVIRYDHTFDAESLSGFFVVVRFSTMTKETLAQVGANAVSDATMKVDVLSCYQGRDTSDATWVADKTHDMLGALTLAIMEDVRRGELAIDTVPIDEEIGPETEIRIADAVALSSFEVLFRHDRANPYQSSIV